MSFMRELRSSLENPATPLSFPAEWLLDLFNGGRTDAGIRVSERTALQVVTVFSCVDIISSNLARLPLNVYELVEAGGTRIADDQDLHWLLHDEPNPEMTSFTFRKVLQCHALLWGNLYGEIVRDAGNRPIMLMPRMPHNTKPRRATGDFYWITASDQKITVKAGELFYSTSDGVDPNVTGGVPERPIHADDIIHIPGLSLDGRLGLDVIELARQAVGLSLAAEKFAGKFFANGLRPAGVVTLPQAMSAPAVENFKRSLQETYGGENIHRPMVLEDGMTWTESTVNPNEAQFLESREFQRQEICALFHVPPHMVGGSKDTNRANAEQMSIEFVQYTLGPWTAPWEQELKRKLFPWRGRNANRFYPGFDTEELLWADAESRGKYFAMGRQWGFFNADDIRKKLRLNPLPGDAGKGYWMPVNMIEVGKPAAPAKPSASEAAPDGGETGDGGGSQSGSEDQRYARAYRVLFSDAFSRSMARKELDLEALSRTFLPVLGAIAEGISMNSWLLQGLKEDPGVGEATQGCIRQHVAGMFKRSGAWRNDAGACERELLEAVKAVRAAVSEDLEGKVKEFQREESL